MSETMPLSTEAIIKWSDPSPRGMGRRHRLVTKALVAIVIVTSPAKAGSSLASEQKLAKCISEASGGKLWLERTLWGLRDQEAGWLGAEIENKNGSYDLGPFQVNSWWVPRLANITGRPWTDVRLWLINDACFNVSVARWIFLTGLSLTRNYWSAIGAYHSPNSDRQRRYVRNVAKRLIDRFGPKVFGTVYPHPVPAKPNSQQTNSVQMVNLRD